VEPRIALRYGRSKPTVEPWDFNGAETTLAGAHLVKKISQHFRQRRLVTQRFFDYGAEEVSAQPKQLTTDILSPVTWQS
jgi:hypothetical protein